MRRIEDWELEADCRGTKTPEDFFPSQGVNPTNARKICPSCPVQSECLNYGIIYDEPGIWGGMTKKERKRLNYLRPKLIQEAKTLGIYENRLSIDRQIAQERAAARLLDEDVYLMIEFPDEVHPLEVVHSQEQLVVEFGPIVHAPAFLDAM